MKKSIHLALIIILSAAFLKSTAFAQTQPSDIVLVNEFVGQADFIEDRLLQLAEEMPQSVYEWRPAEGVRSVSEAFLHSAFANYICVTVSGGEVPEDKGFVMDFSKVNEWDTQTTDKIEIKAKVQESFDVLRTRMLELTEDDLNRDVEVFGMTMSVRNFIISMIAHAHEHLGQEIAYARMNGVTPPWSKKDSEG
jgi:uncharacterized damage-inducible protein DinB